MGYRAVVGVAQAVSELGVVHDLSPCDGCSRPCARACPVGALTSTGVALIACFSHRTENPAGCGRSCLSRRACPVGTSSQYPAAQEHHHQRVAMTAYPPEHAP